MGKLDDFIAREVGPLLAAEEPIMSTVALWRPYEFNLLGAPRAYEAYLAAVTPVRLILISTGRSPAGAFAAPEARNLGVTEFGFDELARVELGAAGRPGGCALTLGFRPGLGPDHVGIGGSVRYDVPPSAEGVGGQRSFFRHFGAWLQGKVTAGAFPPRAETIAKATRGHRERSRLEAGQSDASAGRPRQWVAAPATSGRAAQGFRLLAWPYLLLLFALPVAALTCHWLMQPARPALTAEATRPVAYRPWAEAPANLPPTEDPWRRGQKAFTGCMLATGLLVRPLLRWMRS